MSCSVGGKERGSAGGLLLDQVEAVAFQRDRGARLVRNLTQPARLAGQVLGLEVVVVLDVRQRACRAPEYDERVLTRHGEARVAGLLCAPGDEIAHIAVLERLARQVGSAIN